MPPTCSNLKVWQVNRKMIYQLKREQQLNCTLDTAWDFFSTPRNLDKLTPNSIGFKITHCDSQTMHEGQIIGYKIKLAPLIWITWLTEITHVDNQRSFIDDQRIGPYKLWHHSHHFAEHDGGVIMQDHVTYALPFGVIGKIAHALFIKKQLRHIFDERARLCSEIFNAQES